MLTTVRIAAISPLPELQTLGAHQHAAEREVPHISRKPRAWYFSAAGLA